MHSDHSIELNKQNRELREDWFFFPPGCENRVHVQHPLFPEVCELLSVIIGNFLRLPCMAEIQHVSSAISASNTSGIWPFIECYSIIKRAELGL